MKIMYKPNEYEMKLIILYVIKNLRTSATYTVLDFVVSSSVDLNYFDLQHYIVNLIETENISELIIDNDKVYTLTPSGEETIGFFEKEIPFSVREKLTNNIIIINKRENAASEITADYLPINEREYMVKFNIKETNITLMSVEAYIGDKQRAKDICEYFKENTEKVYTDILNILNNTKK